MQGDEGIKLAVTLDAGIAALLLQAIKDGDVRAYVAVSEAGELLAVGFKQTDEEQVDPTAGETDDQRRRGAAVSLSEARPQRSARPSRRLARTKTETDTTGRSTSSGSTVSGPSKPLSRSVTHGLQTPGVEIRVGADYDDARAPALRV